MPVYLPRAEPLYYDAVPVKTVTKVVVPEPEVVVVPHHKKAYGKSHSHVSVTKYHHGGSKGYSPYASHGSSSTKYRTSYGKRYGYSAPVKGHVSYGGSRRRSSSSRSGYPIRNHYHSSGSRSRSGYSYGRRRW